MADTKQSSGASGGHDNGRPFWHVDHRRTSAPNPNLRVSDAERNEISDLLSQHYQDGRLDNNEFTERVGKAMGAKTHADFHGLLEDLPTLERDDTARQPHPMWQLARIVIISITALVAIGAVTAFVHRSAALILVGLVVLLVARRRRRWVRAC